MRFDTDNGKTVSADGGERRSAPRSPTRRTAQFSAHAGKEFLRDGTVVDISRDGLQLQTYEAPSPGTFVELEIQPRESEWRRPVTLVHGRVARITRLENGQFGAGIRLHMAPLGPSATRIGGSKIEATSAPISSRAADLVPLQTRSPSRDENGVGSQKARRWRWAIVLAALLILFLRVGLPAPRDKRATPDLTQPRRVSELNTASSMTIPTGKTLASLRGQTPRLRATKMQRQSGHTEPSAPAQGKLSAQSPGATVGAPPAAPRMRGQAKPETAPPTIPAAFDALPDVAGLNSVERLLAQVDQAQTALALGRNDEAKDLLNGAAVFAEDYPEVWRKYAEVLTGVSHGRKQDTQVPVFADAIALEADMLAAPPFDGLWIDVNKEDYVLTVMDRNRATRRFPVGLGLNNTTPSGNYRVANKLTNPDWYNRGEVVPAGDPRNPLGKHWMGLGNKRGVPTSYGIHSISHASDLGRPVGRGCIRMIPSDADALFRLCPIGTPVYIHP